jgi:hypothetical protein
VSDAPDLRTATWEYPDDDAGYGWWRNTHPAGLILAVRARREPLLHRADCPEVDRERHPGALKARGSRQICAETRPAIRAWLAAQEPPHTGPVARCPKCAP